jgi:hypothetical protein
MRMRRRELITVRASGAAELFRALAKELVDLRPDVRVAASNVAASALKHNMLNTLLSG